MDIGKIRQTPQIVIIGAGLAGLSAAYRLQQKDEFHIKLFEKNGSVGGTARSIKKNKHLFDLTGHALHLNNARIKNFILNELGLSKDLELVKRKVGIYIDNKFINYPFQYNLAYLNEKQRNQCVIDFLEAHYGKNIKDWPSFQHYCYKVFGKRITDLFMIPYNKKLLNYDLRTIDANSMKKYIPKPDFGEILKGAFIRKEEDLSGYNAIFYYPKSNGIQLIADKINENLRDIVILNAPVTRIDLINKAVYIKDDCFNYDFLISSIPIFTLLKLSDLEFLAKSLKWTIVRAFFISMPSEIAPRFTWLYIADRTKKIYRIGNFDMFNKVQQSGNNSIIWVECSCSRSKRDNLPNYQDILMELKELNIFEIDRAKFIAKMDINPGYVVYDFKTKSHLINIENIFLKHNVILTGRYGKWQYFSMEESMLDGFRAADEVINRFTKKNFGQYNYE